MPSDGLPRADHTFAAGEDVGKPGAPLVLLGWREALTQQPAPATITADGPTTALAIAPAAFLQLLRETPALQHHFVVAAAADFRHAQAALQVRASAMLHAQLLSLTDVVC